MRVFESTPTPEAALDQVPATWRCSGRSSRNLALVTLPDGRMLDEVWASVKA
jgi:hypothetical protein